MQNANGKIALVTGANKGIGLEVARQLGDAGFTVLMGARDTARGNAAADTLRAAGLDVHAVALDLASPKTIEATAAQIAERFTKLDVLVNNAGIADQKDGPPSTADVEAISRTMATNFVGAVAVMQAMLPLLRTSEAARIVNVSSGLGSITQNGDSEWPFAAIKFLGYSASKAALNMFTVQLAYELRATKIKVNAADPGYTATDMNGHQGNQTVAEGAAAIMRLSLLPEDGPTGGFFDAAGPVPW